MISKDNMLKFIKNGSMISLLVSLFLSLIPTGLFYAALSVLSFVITKSGGDATWVEPIRFWGCVTVYNIVALAYFVVFRFTTRNLG